MKLADRLIARAPAPPFKREPMPVRCEICQWRGKRIRANSAPCPACGSRVQFA